MNAHAVHLDKLFGFQFQKRFIFVLYLFHFWADFHRPILNWNFRSTNIRLKTTTTIQHTNDEIDLFYLRSLKQRNQHYFVRNDKEFTIRSMWKQKALHEPIYNGDDDSGRDRSSLDQI